MCFPGCEGKVGMAAVQLAPGQTFDGQKLYQHVRAWLPAYAVPHFVRVQVSQGGPPGEAGEGSRPRVSQRSFTVVVTITAR